MADKVGKITGMEAKALSDTSSFCGPLIETQEHMLMIHTV